MKIEFAYIADSALRVYFAQQKKKQIVILIRRERVSRRQREEKNISQQFAVESPIVDA